MGESESELCPACLKGLLCEDRLRRQAVLGLTPFLPSVSVFVLKVSSAAHL